MRVYRVTIKSMDDEGGYVNENLSRIAEMAADEAEACDIGDAVTIHIEEMTQAEYDALPEFQGW